MVLRRDRHSQLVYKSTISTIMPMMAVELLDSEKSLQQGKATLSLAPSGARQGGRKGSRGVATRRSGPCAVGLGVGDRLRAGGQRVARLLKGHRRTDGRGALRTCLPSPLIAICV